ncbi:MAG: hypothetical protein V2I51_01855 [Anderseniella sp.]|nr:hypothetical protein [Anderseniella sp.]
MIAAANQRFADAFLAVSVAGSSINKIDAQLQRPVYDLDSLVLSRALERDAAYGYSGNIQVSPA